MKPVHADHAHWSSVAGAWIDWARASHDAYWAYRESFLTFAGRGEGEALDVGCGEGRVARDLTTPGYQVTASDPVREMVDAARQAGTGEYYVIASGNALPFADARFDLVTAYNVLMDVEDVTGTVREIRRVLRPAGTVAISIVHPLSDRGRFAGAAGSGPFVIENGYFGVDRFDAVEERHGLHMRFAGWSRPLEAYAAALEDAGLAITSLREPVPVMDEGREHMRRWTRTPLFLWIKARPLARR